MEMREGYARLVRRLQQPPTGPVPRLLTRVSSVRVNRYPIKLMEGVEMRREGTRYMLFVDGEQVCSLCKNQWIGSYFTGLGVRTVKGQVFGRGPGTDCPDELFRAFSELPGQLPFALRYLEGGWCYFTELGCFTEMQGVREAYMAMQQLSLASARELLRQPPTMISVGSMGIDAMHAAPAGTDYELAVLARLNDCTVLTETGEYLFRAGITDGTYTMLPYAFPLRMRKEPSNTTDRWNAVLDPQGFVIMS